MRGSGQGRDSTLAEANSGEFFIPDLCTPRSVLVMVLLSELLAIVYVLISSALPDFNWDLLASCSLFVQWIVLLSAALLCGLRQPFSRLSLPLAALASMALILAVTAASSYLALFFLPQLTPGKQDGWWLLRNTLIAVVLAGIMLRYFYLQQQVRLREKLELQARLDSLRARIRPHFLFNTLNSIASLIMSRPEAAEQAVEDLSELFRASLQESQRETTVSDELRLCEVYLGIEQLRLGERLQIDWQIDDEARTVAMPSLVMQPLMENAIYHGISRMPEGGTVKVAVQKTDSELQVIVENPVPAQASRSEGHQMALSNIGQRLQVLYGSGADLQVHRDAQRFKVVLRYPLEPSL
tara:strand:- start:90010 stop:91071 length:1062 start_codon:yes stop_codon:yes gene_type:complete